MVQNPHQHLTRELHFVFVFATNVCATLAQCFKLNLPGSAMLSKLTVHVANLHWLGSCQYHHHLHKMGKVRYAGSESKQQY